MPAIRCRPLATVFGALLLFGMAVQAADKASTIVLYDPDKFGYSNFQVVVSRASGQLSSVRSAAEYKSALANAAAALYTHCDDVEAALTTIRFVQRGGRAAMFCFSGNMTEAVRQIMLETAGLAVVHSPQVDVRNVRFPLEEYVPIGSGPLVRIGCFIWYKLSFVREPAHVARTGRLKDQPSTSLGAVVSLDKGLLLLAANSSYGDDCGTFFRDGGIERSDNEQASLVLAEWLLGKR